MKMLVLVGLIGLYIFETTRIAERDAAVMSSKFLFQSHFPSATRSKLYDMVMQINISYAVGIRTWLSNVFTFWILTPVTGNYIIP